MADECPQYSVGAVARAAGITVRTLHHYDEIGLLTPTGRSASGYRLYCDADVVRLQHLLGYRALGVPLETIATLLDDPTVDTIQQLRNHHRLLRGDIRRLEQQLAAIEKTMEAHQMGIRLTPQEMLEVFGDQDPTEHAAEARERWGNTEAYRQSQRRTSSYTKADWQQMKDEQAEVEAGLLAAYRSGAAATSNEAMAAAEAHRQHISRWFYDCSYDIHRGLAEMYVSDERFTANYERLAEGLATYVHDSIVANADSAGSG